MVMKPACMPYMAPSCVLAIQHGFRMESQLALGCCRQPAKLCISHALNDAHNHVELACALSLPPSSMAAQVKYIWPIQQPITDFGAQRERLKALRQQLGWRLLGCDLLECYEE